MHGMAGMATAAPADAFLGLAPPRTDRGRARTASLCAPALPMATRLLAGLSCLVAVGATPVPIEKIVEDPATLEPLLVPEGYRDLQNITDVLRGWEALFPDRAKVFDITDEWNNGRKTAEGRGVYALKVSDNVQVNEDEPHVLMSGCLHAQELQTPEAILMMAETLLLATDDGNAESAATLDSKYHLDQGQVEKLRRAVNGQQIWLIAVIVSDGYQFVFDSVPSWRKNRTPNVDGSFGIDLNRNYPQGWFSSCSGSENPSSNTFKGVSPASEAETEALINMGYDLRFEKFSECTVSCI
jgi:hypothetical protein